MQLEGAESVEKEVTFHTVLLCVAVPLQVVTERILKVSTKCTVERCIFLKDGLMYTHLHSFLNYF